VVEGVLAGRPVVTSSVCPALDYVRAAVVEVPPDDVAAYADALLRLKTDPELYAQKRVASAGVRQMFYEDGRGWAAAVERAVDLVRGSKA
jgi:glycogen(starch) synthase